MLAESAGDQEPPADSRSRGSLQEWREGALFVEMLPRLKTVVELAEEPVEQVALGCGVPVSVFASAPVVRVGPGRGL